MMLKADAPYVSGFVLYYIAFILMFAKQNYKFFGVHKILNVLNNLNDILFKIPVTASLFVRYFGAFFA